MPSAGPRSTASLASALGVGSAGVYAVVGAGGKTSAVRRLLAERPQALATTTTHLGPAGFGLGLLAVAPDVESLERVERALGRARPLTLAQCGSALRLQSPPLAWHLGFVTRHARELILVEADGAARRLAKLPAAAEPAWPPGPLQRVIVVAGLDALGLPAREALHRPEAFRAAGLGATHVGLEHLALMLQRYARAAPPRVSLTVLLTGESPARRPAVLELARHLERVVRGRLPHLQDPAVLLRLVATPDIATGPFHVWDLGRGPEPARRGRATIRARRQGIALPGVCGVLLAAGQGTRFGAARDRRRAAPVASKLLVTWHGRTLVESAVRAWSAAGFAALVVITGHEAACVERLIEGAAAGGTAPLRVVRNRQHARGLGSSVRAAVRAAPPDLALLIGHADMPAVRPATLRRLAVLGSTLRRCIVVPTSAGAPRNPVYFPADLRRALARVPDQGGGKPVYEAHRDRVLEVELGPASDLRDVDRAADLRRLPRGSRRIGSRRARPRRSQPPKIRRT